MADNVEHDENVNEDVVTVDDLNVKDDKGNAPEAATDTKDFNDAQTLRFTVDVLYDKDVKRRASTLSIVDVIERAVNGATLHLSATSTFKYEVLDGDLVTEAATVEADKFAEEQAQPVESNVADNGEEVTAEDGTEDHSVDGEGKLAQFFHNDN